MPIFSPSTLDRRAVFYMSLLALQFGIQPILTKKFTPPNIIRSTVILVQELVKFTIAAAMLSLSGERKAALKGWKISTWISVALVPAGLYAIQGVAALTAYQNLDGLTFNILNQTKTLSAALCCYLVMGRKESGMQIFSLFLLLLSALIMEDTILLDYLLHTDKTEGLKEEEEATYRWEARHLTHGVAPVLLASFLSGLAGALSQKSLQGADRNSYLFSMELSAASVLLLQASFSMTPDGEQIMEKGFWQGWTRETFIPILTNSAGGVIVGLVTKYAGSVRKGFALIFGIFLSGLVQAFLQPEVAITKEQIIGGLLAAISLHIHATNPYKGNDEERGAGIGARKCWQQNKRIKGNEDANTDTTLTYRNVPVESPSSASDHV